MEAWTQLGWGIGELSVDLDVDVNTPLGLNTPTDTDEEIWWRLSSRSLP